jgi:hypothetical protein
LTGSAKGAVPRRLTAKEHSAGAASHWTTPRPVLRVFLKRREAGCAILAFGLALTGTACQGKHSSVTARTEGDTGSGSRPVSPGASLVRMNDPKASAQLLSGFYAVENNAWRWTAGKFSVSLYTPPAAAQRGATLMLAFSVSDAAVQKLGALTLTASIDGTALQSARYDKAGAYTFTADVPPSMLTADSVKVDFALDKSFRADGDVRELGIIAASVGLADK